MRTAVDSNVLLDLRGRAQPEFEESSFRALKKCAARGPLIICSVVYAELAARFDSHTQLADFLSDLRIECEDLSMNAAFQAGQSFAGYRKAGGKRDRMVADFLIGAHARVHTGRLLTRDRGFYREHFNGIQIVEPV